MANINNSKDKDTKKIATVFILIVALILCETGATYAYFQVTATSNNTLTGTAATANLVFTTTPTLIAPTNSSYVNGKMVPQKSLNGSTNVLQLAFNGASGKDKCVDGNNNVICRAYSFVIKNSSTATVVVKGQVQFTWGDSDTYTNLKWKLMTNSTTVAVASGNEGITVSKNTWQNFATNVSLAPNGTQQYWIIVWIEETGGIQNTTDKGTWYASIKFEDNAGQGITSTITG